MYGIFFTLLLSAISLSTSWDLTILHTNDIHAHFEQMNAYGGECSNETAAANKCYGGYARQATAVKQIREAEDNVVLVSGGDWSQGTVWYYQFEGAASAQVMTKIQYDAAAMGNHEMDKGVETFVQKFLKNVTFPVLSANCDATREPEMKKYIEKSTKVNVDGREVGIIGYTTKEMEELSVTMGDLVFTDEVAAVNEEAKRLKDDGVDIIIAVGHAGFPVDKSIARRCPDVDVVVGGHDNTFLYKGTPPSTEKPLGSYPHVETQETTGKRVPVLVVQDYMFGKYLGRLKVTFDSSGDITEWSGNPILLNSSYEQDPEMLALLKPMMEDLEEMRRKVVGESLVAFIAVAGDQLPCRLGECNLGNLLTDAMVEAEALNQMATSGWSRAAAAIINGGGIRGNLADGDLPSDITTGKILEAYPFGNTIDMVKLKGSTLFKAFEHSVSLFHDMAGRFLQVSGIRVFYDLNKPVGERVIKLEIQCSDCDTPKLEPVLQDSEYNVLMLSYIANGGDGYSFIMEERLDYYPLGILDSDVLREYISKHSPLFGGVEGRINIKLPVDSVSSASPIAGSLGVLIFAVSLHFISALHRGD